MAIVIPYGIKWNPRTGDSDDDRFLLPDDSCIVQGKTDYPDTLDVSDVNGDDSFGINQVVAALNHRGQRLHALFGYAWTDLAYFSSAARIKYQDWGTLAGALRRLIRDKINIVRTAEGSTAWSWSANPTQNTCMVRSYLEEFRKALAVTGLLTIPIGTGQGIANFTNRYTHSPAVPPPTDTLVSGYSGASPGIGATQNGHVPMYETRRQLLSYPAFEWLDSYLPDSAKVRVPGVTGFNGAELRLYRSNTDDSAAVLADDTHMDNLEGTDTLSSGVDIDVEVSASAVQDASGGYVSFVLGETEEMGGGFTFGRRYTSLSAKLILDFGS